MRNFYGQQGEDCLLWSVFNNFKGTGIFLDVGALDGKRFSNTYSFEMAGWSGVCIEAHPFYIPFIEKNRPNSIVVHAAASLENRDEVTFYTNLVGSLSTLDKSMEQYFAGRYTKHFKGFVPVEVPMRTVDSILEEYDISRVHVVSIDVEGTELDVLKGFDLHKYKPRVLVIEALDKLREQALRKYMLENGYICCPRRLANNYFFCKNPDDVKTIKRAKIQKQIHTDHPLKKEAFSDEKR